MLKLRNPIMATLRSLRIPYPCHPSLPLQNPKSQFLFSRLRIHGFLPYNHLRTLSTSATSNSSSSDPNDDQWFKSNDFFTQEDSFSSSSIATDEDWYKAQAEDLEWFRKEDEFYEKMDLLDEKQPTTVEVPDYLSLSDSALFAQCRMDTFRASGPGGQHRNKTDSGVRLTHVPTGVVAQAVEDRSQHKNRAIAMNRLRILIAGKVRRPVKLRGYKPPPELFKILPSEEGKKSSNVKIGVNNPDYAKGVQSLLDLLAASQGFVTYAATILRVSPASISKILTIDKTVMQAANEVLISKGQKPFK